MNKNITFVTHYTSLYGANRSLLNLVDGLKKYDFKISLVAPNEGEIVDEFRKRILPVAIFPIELWVSLNSRPRITIKHLRSSAKSYYQWKRAAFRRIAINFRLLSGTGKTIKVMEP